MASQLIKVTNAFTGEWEYIVQDKIESFWENKKSTGQQYKKPILTWIAFTGREDATPIAEPVQFLLDKYPPL